MYTVFPGKALRGKGCTGFFYILTYRNSRGYIEGFHIDLLRAVCKRAHKECYFMVDQHKHCWDSDDDHEYPGVGELNRLGWIRLSWVRPKDCIKTVEFVNTY